MKIEVYADPQKAVWDQFVEQSKNGTFLFLRDYMDYHRDRFHDHSLMVYDDSDKLLALLPANATEATLVSHGGLTYGGFVVDATMKLPRVLELFDLTLTWLRERGFSRWLYKTIPSIYHQAPAEEDRYALFLCGARIVRRGVLAVIDSRHRLPFQERRTRGAKKALQNGLTVRPSNDFAAYWQILTERLLKVYNTAPVHTLAEIECLHSRFPDNIKLFGCFEGSTLLAGVVVYESELVAHVQYIAASERGREMCGLDLVFSQLVSNYYGAKPYFDFGTSDEENGSRLNKGLIDQKEGFGARVLVHDHYEISLTERRPGEVTGAMN